MALCRSTAVLFALLIHTPLFADVVSLGRNGRDVYCSVSSSATPVATAVQDASCPCYGSITAADRGATSSVVVTGPLAEYYWGSGSTDGFTARAFALNGNGTGFVVVNYTNTISVDGYHGFADAQAGDLVVQGFFGVNHSLYATSTFSSAPLPMIFGEDFTFPISAVSLWFDGDQSGFLGATVSQSATSFQVFDQMMVPLPNATVELAPEPSTFATLAAVLLGVLGICFRQKLHGMHR